MDGDLAPADAVEDLAQRRQVEHVGEALAVGLHEDREAPVSRGDGQQVRRPLPLLPERGAGARAATREEQRPRRVLPEPAGEQARLPHPADHQVLDLLGIREQQGLDAVHARLALGQPDRDAVVGPDRLDLEAEALREPGLERHRPRRVDPAAERRQDDEAPVAQLVAEALDDDAPVRRQDAGRPALVLEIGDEVLGGERDRGRGRAGSARSPRPGRSGRVRGRPRPRG